MIKPLSLKLLTLGDSSVGKTSILLHYTQLTSQLTHMPTIGVDYKHKHLSIDGQPLKLNIWDTAGQQRYSQIVKSFYRDAQGIVLCFSVTDRESYMHIQKWLQDIMEKAALNTPIVVIGNKNDLENREVSEAEGRDLAMKYCLPYFDCSAKTGANIEEAFDKLVRLVLSKKKESKGQPKISGTKITIDPTKRTGDKCC